MPSREFNFVALFDNDKSKKQYTTKKYILNITSIFYKPVKLVHHYLNKKRTGLGITYGKPKIAESREISFAIQI